MEDDELDNEIEHLEEELKKIDDKDSYGSPSSTQKDNMFKFFKHILTIKDTTRIGNVKESELGLTKLGVRHYLELANYAKVEELSDVEQYWIDRANIMTATSMAKNGFWPQLFVTQIKKEQKVKEPTKIKRSWFGGRKEKEEED